MNKLILVIGLLVSSTTHARTVAVSCDIMEYNVIFATDIDKDAKEIHRIYDYAPDLAFAIRVPVKFNGPAFGQASVNEKGKTRNAPVICTEVSE